MIDSLAKSYCELKVRSPCVWISSSYQPFVPNNRSDAEEAYKIALDILKRHSFDLTKTSHMRFLNGLMNSFQRCDVDLRKMESAIETISRLSHLAFKSKTLSPSPQILQDCWEKIDWSPLPYDQNLRKTCDVVFFFQKEGAFLAAHSLRLRKVSGYFRALLSGSFLENRQKEPIVLEGVSSETFINFLKAIYLKKTPLKFAELHDLTVYADMIQLDSLVKNCNRAIKRYLRKFPYNFDRMSLKDLEVLLKRDDLPINDPELWELLLEKGRCPDLHRFVRFENFTQRQFKNVIEQNILPIEDIDNFTSMINAKTRTDEYRPIRPGSVILNVVPLSTKRTRIIAKIPLTQKDLIIDAKRSPFVIKRTPTFKMFGYKWRIQLSQRTLKQILDNSFELVLLEVPNREVILDHSWYGVNPSFYFSRWGLARFIEPYHKKEGWYFHPRELPSYLHNGRLHIELECEMKN